MCSPIAVFRQNRARQDLSLQCRQIRSIFARSTGWITPHPLSNGKLWTTTAMAILPTLSFVGVAPLTPVRIRSNPLRAQQGNDGSFSWHHVLLTYITTHSFRSSSVPSPSGRAHTITGIHAQDLNPSPLYRACRGTVQGFGTVPRLWTAGRINPGFSIHSPSSTACRSQH